MGSVKRRAKKGLEFTGTDRDQSEILIVEPDAQMKGTLKSSLMGLGFSRVTDAQDHYGALEKIQQRPITHVLFDAKETNMKAADFLTHALEQDERIVALPLSFEPTLDDVFDLLVLGARGYIVKPFTPDSLDAALLWATKGEALSEAILFAKDRNQALASFALSSLDKLASLTAEARRHETAEYELPRARLQRDRAFDIARTFAKGGPPELVIAMIEYCCERANGPATKLGRIRKRRALPNESRGESSPT